MNTNDFKNKVLPLAERIYPMVARMLRNRENAEDAVQEIMIKLWDRRKQVGQHPNIPGFVFLTARNYCLDLLKKKNPKMEPSEELKIGEPGKSQDPMEWKELLAIVENLLAQLPELQRDVMIMRDIDGLEFAEIATVTKLNVEHVRVLLSRARKHVAKKLKDIYSYE